MSERSFGEEFGSEVGKALVGNAVIWGPSIAAVLLMDWDELMQHMEMPLLCMAGFSVLYCLGLLAAEPVGLLIGHTLMLFPAFRRYMAKKQTEEFFGWWDEHYPKGITANIYYRVGDGEWQLSRTFDLAITIDSIEMAEFESQAALREWLTEHAPAFVR